MTAMKPLVLAFAAAVWVTLPALAAIPPQKPEMLKDNATHIVVGKVQGVYSTEVMKKAEFVDRHYVIEVEVTAVEKGEGVQAQKVIYVKAWKPAGRPRGWAGPQGQNVIPAAGDTGRLYVTRAEDGTFTLLTPNGWEAVK